MMPRFVYYYLHIPTRQHGRSSFVCASLADVYEELNNWNAKEPGVYQFWTLGEMESGK